MYKFLLCSLLFVSQAAVADPAFSGITADDLEGISNEMSANFTHNSMMGASKMGMIFGFQVGLVGAVTDAPKIDAIAKRNTGAELPKLYNGGLMGALGLPFGISLEAIVLPEMEVAGTKVSSTSLAFKYNINEVIPVLPVNLALRGVYSTAKMSFQQTVSGVTSNVKNETSVTGLQLLFSPMIPIVEPYIGVGILNGSDTLSNTGVASIFDPSFTTGQSESKNVSTTQLLAGVEVSLLVFKLGAEYSQAFGTSRYGLKMSLGF